MVFCSKCGTRLDDDARFCGSCGQTTDLAQPMVQAQPMTQAQPMVQPMLQAQPMQAMQAQPGAGVAVIAPTEVLTGFRAEVQADGHFSSPRIFEERIYTPVAVSDNGFVGTWQIEQTGRAQNMLAAFGGKKAARVFVALHANEIVSFEVLEKQTSGAGAAALGGLAFGAAGAMVGSLAGAGKSTRIDLKIVTTRPDNPMIMINLYDKNGTIGSVANPNALKQVTFSAASRAKKMDSEIMTLCSSLESLLARRAAQQAVPQTVVQQASAADELLKFKQLLDAGVITQQEFDAKKRQLIG